MKKSVRVTGIIVMLATACTFSLNAQRGMRGMPDSTRLNRPGRDAGMRRMMPPQEKGDTLHMNPMRRDFRGGRPGMGRGPEFALRHDSRNGMRGLRNFQGDRFGMRPPMEGAGRIESLQGLTDKQRTDIQALREKQQAEVKKLRDEFAAKMQVVREEQRKKVTALLTEEQKKQLGELPAASKPAATKVK